MSDAEKTSAGPAAEPPLGNISDLAQLLAQAPEPAGGSKSYSLHLVRLLGMLAICFLVSLLVMAFMGGEEPVTVKPPEDEKVLIIRQPAAPLAPVAQQAAAPAPETQPAGVVLEPASWDAAEKAYAAGRLAEAGGEYRRLIKLAQAVQADTLLADYFCLRLALCYDRMGRSGDSDFLLQSVSRSNSARVRAFACCTQAVRALRQGQYLQARMLAYQALAAAASLDVRLPLETDCEFLIARAMTEHCLSLQTNQSPADWPEEKPADPFAGLDENRLRAALHEGLKPGSALLGAKIEPAEAVENTPHWQVVCVACPLDDLVQRFAARSHIEVSWMFPSLPARQRALDLAVARVPAQRLLEIAAGSVALIARYDGQKVSLFDPQGYDSTSQHRDLLSSEAMAAWRRVFLRYPADDRVLPGRFGLACLQEFSGQAMAAIQEYHLVAQRYPNSPQAPQSLFRASALRMQLKDYAGSRDDLINLLDRYPSQAATRQVYLGLGQSAALAGQWQESYKAYNKLYYLDQAPESRLDSCLGAGRALYQLERYADAAEWLSRFGQHGGKVTPDNAETMLLLARCQVRQGELREAAGTCRQILQVRPARAMRVQTMLELGQIELQREQMVWVLETVRRLDGEDLSPAETAQKHVLAARAYSGMLLHEKASDLLRNAVRDMDQGELRALLQLELARCLAHSGHAGDLASAQQTLTDVLPSLPLAQSYPVQCELADILMKMDKPAQAIVVLEGLLKSACPADVRSRASELLGLAHAAQQNYHKAAMALSEPNPKPAGGQP